MPPPMSAGSLDSSSTAFEALRPAQAFLRWLQARYNYIGLLASGSCLCCCGLAACGARSLRQGLCFRQFGQEVEICATSARTTPDSPMSNGNQKTSTPPQPIPATQTGIATALSTPCSLRPLRMPSTTLQAHPAHPAHPKPSQPLTKPQSASSTPR